MTRVGSHVRLAVAEEEKEDVLAPRLGRAVISGWPVQFLPPVTPLVEEALAQAVVTDIDGTPARVFTAEHLAAIALQTGRAKDKARLLQFIECGKLDNGRFQDIVLRHGLQAAWQRFKNQFLSDTP